MNKRTLLILPLLALSIAGCNKNNKPSDDEEDIYAPGTVPAEPSGGESSGSGSDHTSPGDQTTTITGIVSIETSPENIDINEEFDLTSVTLKLLTSTGSHVYRHPQSINYDASGKSIGDSLTITANYGNFSDTFVSTIYIMPHDTIDVSATGTTSTTYKTWTYDAPNSNAVYKGYTSGNGKITLATDKKNDGFTGIVTSYSAGRVKQIKIEWDYAATTSEKAELLVFGQSAPYFDNNDLEFNTRTNSFLQLKKQETVYSYKPTENYYYLAFKATGAGLSLKSISIYWDEDAEIPTLESMSYSEDSYVTSETDQTDWDYSKMTVIGTYSDFNAYDITKLVSFSSVTPVSTTPVDEIDVEVVASYDRDDGFEPYHGIVKGSVAVALKTRLILTYGSTTIGATITENMDNDNTNHCWRESSTTQENYVQIKNNSALWTESPEHIYIFVVAGYGYEKQKALTNSVYVVLIDSSGNEIGTRTKLTSNIETKTGFEYSVEVPNAENVYGYKIIHAKEASTNLRFFSARLRTLN